MMMSGGQQFVPVMQQGEPFHFYTKDASLKKCDHNFPVLKFPFMQKKKKKCKRED